MKNIRLAYHGTLGLLGGLLAWSLLQAHFLIAEYLPLPELDSYFYEGWWIGFGLGALLPARSALWNHHHSGTIISLLTKGSLLGAVSGFLCFGFGQSLLGIQLPLFVVRVISWLLLGSCLGAGAGLLNPSPGLMKPRIFYGGIGGFAAGCIFELFLLYPLMNPVQLTGLLAGGMMIFLVLSLFENLQVHSFLRLLNGSQEGQVYLLDQTLHKVGYGRHNDLILDGYAEVCDLHAYLSRKGRQLIIENAETGGDVLVNYRFVNQQSMKRGDIIKLGTALLQYHEV